MLHKRLECQVSELVNSDMCPRPMTHPRGVGQQLVLDRMQGVLRELRAVRRTGECAVNHMWWTAACDCDDNGAEAAALEALAPALARQRAVGRWHTC
jgi:hypothetical protein